MSCFPCQCKEDIRQHALALGAVACGFAKAEPVDADALRIYDDWIRAERHGTMDYCEKYTDVRHDPRLLLDGASTVICCAFNYYNSTPENITTPRISRYAWGNDYHWVIKSRLNQLADYITDTYGGDTRVLVDTAPLRERYWAQQAGIGCIGINNQLIVPGIGSYVVLGEVLWTGECPADEPCTDTCAGCLACVKACPAGALNADGSCDTCRCLSYLTIEHRGDLPEGTDLKGCIYGCDRCLDVCPHNKQVQPTQIAEFLEINELVTLSDNEIESMTPSRYKKLTEHSAMRRVPFKQLIRNIEANKKHK